MIFFFIFPKILLFFRSSLFLCNCPEVQTARFYYTVTCNNPSYNIKGPGKYLFSLRFISGWITMKIVNYELIMKNIPKLGAENVL